MFFTRVQGPNEKIDAYVTDLKNKAKDCEFAQLTDELIKDRVVCGINNDTVRARLLRETDLTLTKAVDICRASEVTQNHMKALHEETAQTARIRLADVGTMNTVPSARRIMESVCSLGRRRRDVGI